MLLDFNKEYHRDNELFQRKVQNILDSKLNYSDNPLINRLKN